MLNQGTTEVEVVSREREKRPRESLDKLESRPTVRHAVRVTLTIRFPMGATEFRLAETVPGVGEVVARRGGQVWVARSVTQRTYDSFLVTVTAREEVDVEFHTGTSLN